MVNIMNSEISNVVKLSPVTVMKADKQTNDRSTKEVKVEESVRTDASANSKTAEIKNGEQTDDNRVKDTLDLVKQAADEGNTLLQAVKRNLLFTVDESTQELVVKIVDSESGEVVKQIPSEEMLAFVKRMKELEGTQGFVIQDRA
jgi:flagellar protein FlaG